MTHPDVAPAALLADRPPISDDPRGPYRHWHVVPAGETLGRDHRWWSGVWAALLARYSGHDQVWLAGANGEYEVTVTQDMQVGDLISTLTVALDQIASPPTGRLSAPIATIAGDVMEHRGVGDIGLELIDDTVSMTGDAQLWEVETLHRLAGQLQLLAQQAADAPGTPLDAIDLLTAANRQLITDEWNGTTADWPSTSYLDLIAEQVRVRPDAPAVEQGDLILSFAELDRRSNRIAAELVQAGVMPGDRVGLFCPRGADYVLAVFGILKAGAAIVPLDPVNPDPRISFMVRDSAATAVLTIDDLRDRLPTDPLVLGIPRTGSTVLAKPPTSTADLDIISHLIYTSGSTGEPKAVLERLRAIENLVHWTGRAYGVRPGDRASWLSAPGFGVQIMEWMPYLALGATVCIPVARHALSPAQLRDWLVAEKITHTMLVAALAEPAWALDWPADAALRIMVTTAERVHSWPPVDTPFRVVMTYGTTETTNALTCLDLGAGIDLTSQATSAHVKSMHPVPAGRPIANARAYILDPFDRPTPPGMTGRLVIGGVGLSAGYHNRPELTAKLFRPDPVLGTGQVYETGDLARYRADGAIEILGRGDAQVKIRGFRVELGEVESALVSCTEVAEAIVTTVEKRPGDRLLSAYVTAADGAELDSASLKVKLGQRLPYYMVPSFVTPLQAIPRLPNGKTDLRSLPEPDLTTHSSDDFVSARTETEATMARLWTDLFADRPVSMTDNFFSLGGHSLLAFRLIDELRNRLGVELSMTELYANPTAGELSAAVDVGRAGTAAFADLPPIKPNPLKRFDPFPLNEGQQAMWIGRGNLVDLGNVGCHGYFEWESEDLDLDAFEQAWQSLVERHDALRTVMADDGTQQVLAQVPPVHIARHDLMAVPDPDSELLAIRHQLSHTTLDAARWPLFDLSLTVLPGGRTRIHLVLDFLIADAWSYFQVIVPELSELYAGLGSKLEPLELTFRDYVLGLEANLETSEVYQRSQWYWLDRLESLPGAPHLPPRPADQVALPSRVERYNGTINAEQWASIAAMASKYGVTGSGALASAYAEVLRSWSTEPSFCLNFPLFSRLPLHPQVTKVIGHTTTTLLLEAADTGPTFADRARTLQSQLWSDLEHRHFTGIQVLRALTRMRGTLVPAMPVVMTSLVGYPPDQRTTTFGSAVYGVSQTPQVSLDFQVFETDDGGLRFNWDYVQAVYPDGLIGDMFAAFLDLLHRLADSGAWQTEDFEYGIARHAVGTIAGQAEHSDAKRSGTAWEQYWSSVGATGRGGDVLWDADDAEEFARIREAAAQYFDPGLPVIDLGCGNGRYARALASRFRNVVGVDVSPTAIAKARAETDGYSNLAFDVIDPSDLDTVKALATRIGPANVFVRAVLHVLSDEERADVAAAITVLTGGQAGVIIIEPDYAASSFGYLGHVGGTRGRAAELVRPLEAAGVQHSTRFNSADLDRYFPTGQWRRDSSRPADMHAVDPESDQSTLRVPGYFAAIRPVTANN